MENRTLEVCCESFTDVKNAQSGGANRVELNSALALGGLTPSLTQLVLAKKRCTIPVITMIRPRGAGFYYSDEEFEMMCGDAAEMLRHGADGIAFGILTADARVDEQRTEQLIAMAHENGKEAVFHRAFDCCNDMNLAAEVLIRLGADRILTSGGAETAQAGGWRLRQLQKDYGSKIQFLAGSGVNADNAAGLIQETGITQLHSSCKIWRRDVTTLCSNVSFGFGGAGHEDCYHCVSAEAVRALAAQMRA